MPQTAQGWERSVITQGTQTPAAAGTFTPDLSQGMTWVIQMPAGNITVANPINAFPGDHLALVVIQDGVGARTVTWGSAYRKSITLSVTANARDAMIFLFDGTLWNQVGSVLAIA